MTIKSDLRPAAPEGDEVRIVKREVFVRAPDTGGTFPDIEAKIDFLPRFWIDPGPFRAKLQADFEKARLTNPIVSTCMTLAKNGHCTRDEALMLAVVELVKVNDKFLADLVNERADAMWLRGQAMIPTTCPESSPPPQPPAASPQPATPGHDQAGQP